MKKGVYVFFSIIVVILGIFFYLAPGTIAENAISSQFATHVDIPIDVEKIETQGINPSQDTQSDFNKVIVIQNFLDVQRTLWLVKDKETGMSFVLKAIKNHGYGIGSEALVEGKTLPETINGLPVIEILEIPHDMHDHQQSVTGDLLQEIEVLENSLPQSLRIALIGQGLTKDMQVSVLLQASLSGETVDVWSNQTDWIWDDNIKAYIFTMKFDNTNLPEIAKNPNATFVIKAWPTEDVEGQYAIEKQINNYTNKSRMR
jgi:hypothetical protein